MSRNDPPDAEMLIDYLLGSLPDEKTEQLDELSIADDEFAARLNEAENELIDAYVTGRLDEGTRARVEDHYNASAPGQRKLRFADALQRRVPASASSPRAQRAREPFIFSFMLVPAMRGAAAVPTVVIPPGAELIRWTLTDVDEFPTYTVAIRNVSTEKVVWRQDDLRAGTAHRRSIDITVTVSALEAGAYVVELSGTSADGAATMINGYPIRVTFGSPLPC
jgi:hypothetical protein